MKTRRIIQLLAGIAIAGLGLWLFLRNVNFSELGDELQDAPVGGLALTMLLGLLTLVLRSIRWRIMLPDQPGASKRRLLDYVVIGFAINNVIPARVGEAARALLLWKKNGYPVMISLGSLIVERIIDSLMFLTFFSIPAFILPNLQQARPFAVIASAIVVGFVLAAAAYRLFTAQITSAALRMATLLPQKLSRRIIPLGTELASTLEWIFSARKTVSIVALSFLTSICYPIMMVALLPEKLGLLGGMFSQAFAALGAAIPLAPGYVGTLHASLGYGLGLLGIGENTAAALAIIYHAANVIPVTLAGFFYIVKTGVSMQEVTHAREQLHEDEQEEEGTGLRSAEMPADPSRERSE